MNKYRYEHIKTDMKQPIFISIYDNEAKPFIIEEHWHKSIEINYFMSSRADYYVDGEHIPVEKDEMIIINSGSVHKVVTNQEESSAKGDWAISVSIPTALFNGHISEIESLRFVAKPEHETEKVKEIMKKLADLQRKEFNEYDYMQVMSLAWEVLFHLCQHFQVKQEGAEARQIYGIELIQQIMEYINAHFCEDLSVQDIADQFNFSREYISRVFKRYTGTTIIEHITKTRMEYAYRELVETQRSVENIAVLFGFGDARNFIKYFKRYFNSTPLQYRKKLQNGNF